MTLHPGVPLRLLSQYQHVQFPATGTMEEKKAALRVLLENCKITAYAGTEQMGLISDPDLLEDVCEMRRVALEAIQLGEAALREPSLKNLIRRRKNFVRNMLTSCAQSNTSSGTQAR